MTPDIKELVKRLRATMNWGGNVGTRPVNQDGPEAADALEVMAGEVERYRERHKGFMTLQTALERVAGEKAAVTTERDRLKEALQPCIDALISANTERDRLKAENDLFYAFCNAAWSVGGLDVDWIRLAFINPLRVYKARKALEDKQ